MQVGGVHGRRQPSSSHSESSTIRRRGGVARPGRAAGSLPWRHASSRPPGAPARPPVRRSRRDPPRVFWVRRVVVLGVVGAVVWALVGLVGMLDLSADGETSPAGHDRRSDADTDPRRGRRRGRRLTKAERRAPPGRGRAARAQERKREEDATRQPSGTCAAGDVVVTPSVPDGHAGSEVTVVLELTTVESPACTWDDRPRGPLRDDRRRLDHAVVEPALPRRAADRHRGPASHDPGRDPLHLERQGVGARLLGRHRVGVAGRLPGDRGRPRVGEPGRDAVHPRRPRAPGAGRAPPRSPSATSAGPTTRPTPTRPRRAASTGESDAPEPETEEEAAERREQRREALREARRQHRQDQRAERDAA